METRSSVRRGSRKLALIIGAALFVFARPMPASADDQPAEAPPAAQVCPAPEPEGLLPLPDYGGAFCRRAYLTGDWNCVRTRLANRGVQFDVDWVQAVQSVTSGGRETGTAYGGSLDYMLQLDLQKMCILRGALLKVRGETRYGDSVNDMSGLLLPVSTDGYMPLTDVPDETIPFALTNVTYYQFLSDTFAVFLGKFDTLDGDLIPFASGRGNTQFLNSNFVFNSVASLTVPYCTLGAGLAWQASPRVGVSASVFNTADSSTTTGFEHLDDGWTASAEAAFQYALGSLPGGMNVGGMYAWDQDFAQLDERLVFRPGEGLSAQTQDSSWSVYWSGWQYLCTKDRSCEPVVREGGRPDREGVGLFARFGFADAGTNPIEWSASGGIGGRGLFCCRGNDLFGLGYFYNSIISDRLTSLLDIGEQAQGVEGFYSFAITPAAQLTFDVQWVDGVFPNADPAWIFGLRLFLQF